MSKIIKKFEFKFLNLNRFRQSLELFLTAIRVVIPKLRRRRGVQIRELGQDLVTFLRVKICQILDASDINLFNMSVIYLNHFACEEEFF